MIMSMRKITMLVGTALMCMSLTALADSHMKKEMMDKGSDMKDTMMDKKMDDKMAKEKDKMMDKDKMMKKDKMMGKDKMSDMKKDTMNKMKDKMKKNY